MSGSDGRCNPLDGPDEPVHEFPCTRWSLIARITNGATSGGGVDASERREALGLLLTRYVPPLRTHLLRRRRIRADRVEDLVQAFIADKVIERDLLAAADAARGRFRAFLATALDNFVANRLRDETARSRAPGSGTLVSLDATAAAGDARPAADGTSAPDAFDVEWARQTLVEALRRTRADCLADARGDLWDVLVVRVLRPALEDAPPMAYDAMVARFGYASPKQAANALVTAKRRFVQALRSVVAEYAADEEDLERELGSLSDVLAAAARAGRSGDDWDLGAALGEAGPCATSQLHIDLAVPRAEADEDPGNPG